jgi:hypothetical protein
MPGKVDPNIKRKSTPKLVSPVRSSTESPGSDARLREHPDTEFFRKAWTQELDGPDEPPLNVSDYELTMTQSDVDMLSQSPTKKDWIPVKPGSSLAMDRVPKPRCLHIHANNRITMMNTSVVPPRDESTSRKIQRYWRQWRALLDPTDRDQLKPPGRYTRYPSNPGYEKDGDTRLGFLGGWADVPGFELSNPEVLQVWDRWVLDWVVVVDKHPEFPAFAFIVVVDETSTCYRVRQSKYTKVPPQAEGSTPGWKNRIRDPKTIARMVSETKPNPDPDRLAKKGSWATDTGWIDYTAQLHELS